MIDIFCDPGLEQAMGGAAYGSPAIYKSLVHTPHFGDMRVGGDPVAVRELEAEGGFRMRLEVMFEFCELHGCRIKVRERRVVRSRC